MKHLIFIAFMALTLAPSCKKEDTPPTFASNKLLTSIEYQYSDDTSSVEYTYDNKSRVITSDDGDDQVTYEYTNNEVIIKEWRTSENREVFYFKGTLDANGYISAGTATSKYSPNFTYQQQHTYEYDANGYLTKATILRDNGQKYEYRYTFSGGNLMKQESFTNDVLDVYFLYEYASGYPNNTKLSSTSHFLPVNTLMGKNSAQKNVKFTRVRPGVPDDSTVNSYTTDADGYVVRQNSVQLNGSTYTVLYHYN